MRLRLWSAKRDGRLCSFCREDALYVMEMKLGSVLSRSSVGVTRFCQPHVDEMRTMFGADAEQFYPKDDDE